jgi:hypothetical protein
MLSFDKVESKWTTWIHMSDGQQHELTTSANHTIGQLKQNVLDTSNDKKLTKDDLVFRHMGQTLVDSKTLKVQ